MSAYSTALQELESVLRASRSLADEVAQASRLLVECLYRGGKVLSCGNGGSAADALHLAEELVGRYARVRRPLAALCLNADPTSLTCIANDYGFEHVFARSLEALGQPGDVLVAFSTSGSSPNVVKVLATARQRGLKSVLLAGKDGGEAKALCDCAIVVPSHNTARIQELHTLILHSWLEDIDAQPWLE